MMCVFFLRILYYEPNKWAVVIFLTFDNFSPLLRNHMFTGAVMSNLTIRWRLLALVSFMLSVISVMGILFVLDTHAKVVNADRVSGMVQFSTVVGSVVHELQKERGTSAVFLGSKGEKFSAELRDQRGASDKVLSNYSLAVTGIKDSADQNLLQQMAKTSDALSKLPPLRQQVDALAVDGPTAAGPYTQAISGLLREIEGISASAADPEIAKEAAAYINFLHGKERAGQERAAGGGAFASGKFDGPALRRLSGLSGAQDAFFASFAMTAPEAILAKFRANEAETGADLVKLRQVAVDSIASGTVGDVTGPMWFAMATKRIEGLKAVEDILAQDLITNAQAIATLDAQKQWAVGGFLFVVVVGTAIVVLRGVSRNITGPITRLTTIMKQLADGRTEIQVLDNERHDEIGHMARAVEVFREQAVDNARLRQEQLESEARAREERRQVMLSMADSLEGRIRGISSAIDSSVRVLHDAADNLSANAEQTQRQSAAVASATEQASANVGTVSAASVELTAAIHEISRQVTEAASVAATAKAEAASANGMIAGLEHATAKIGEVVDLINSIANQTNLLALNATIESARAGEAGKGFAIVAHEVKNLAGQTGRATEDIAAQMAAIQSETRSAVSAIEAIARTIERIGEMSSSIASAVEEQGAATAEIARNVEQANAGTREVASNIGGVAHAAADTGRMAQGVFTAAGDLLKESNSLEGEVESFLKELRAV